jgi:hypothetical protein
MFIPFKNLNSSARTWIYQADRQFSEEQKSLISQKLTQFTEDWLVHGSPLEASFEIRHDQFVILAANDTASGCSIDSSVRVMKEIGSQTGIDFFNRNLIAFQAENEIRVIDMAFLKKELQEGSWDESSVVFNNVASTLQDLNERWLVPAGTTWLKRYLPKELSWFF